MATTQGSIIISYIDSRHVQPDEPLHRPPTCDTVPKVVQGQAHPAILADAEAPAWPSDDGPRRCLTNHAGRPSMLRIIIAVGVCIRAAVPRLSWRCVLSAAIENERLKHFPFLSRCQWPGPARTRGTVERNRWGLGRVGVSVALRRRTTTCQEDSSPFAFSLLTVPGASHDSGSVRRCICQVSGEDARLPPRLWIGGIQQSGQRCCIQWSVA